MTPEEKKEYNRVKQAETRAKKKALKIRANSPEVDKKAREKYKKKNPEKILICSKEVGDLFNEKKKALNLTTNSFLLALLEKV